MKKLNVGILLFDDVEVLDFAGPFEVFSRTRLTPGAESRRSEDSAPFQVFTVAKTKQSIQAVGNLVVEPHYSFSNAPRIDLAVIPGGWGSRKVMQDPESSAGPNVPHRQLGTLLTFARERSSSRGRVCSRAGGRPRTGPRMISWSRSARE
jgi:putative intracellular protease/amidase